MLNQYEKRAIARITREKTDAEREAIGQDDTLARELIAKAKDRWLAYSSNMVAEHNEQLARWTIEKEIWENVEGLPAPEPTPEPTE